MNNRTEEEVMLLAHRLMTKHHIAAHGWSFNLNKRLKKALGITRPYPKDGNKRIELKYSFALRATDEEVEQVLLHEIAHVMAGIEHNHDEEFQLWAKHIGVTERFLKSSTSGITEHEDKNWVAKCHNCNELYYRVTAPNLRSRKSCGSCSGGRFNELYELTYVRLI